MLSNIVWGSSFAFGRSSRGTSWNRENGDGKGSGQGSSQAGLYEKYTIMYTQSCTCTVRSFHHQNCFDSVHVNRGGNVATKYNYDDFEPYKNYSYNNVLDCYQSTCVRMYNVLYILHVRTVCTVHCNLELLSVYIPLFVVVCCLQLFRWTGLHCPRQILQGSGLMRGVVLFRRVQ